MGKRVLILSAGVGSGHNTAAAVLESRFQAREVAAVQAIDVLQLSSDLFRTLAGDAYFQLVDAVPWLVGWGYDRNDVPFRSRNTVSIWDQLNTAAAVKAIEAYRPDTIVCTHFLPARLVSLLLTRRELRATMSVVTTDYDFQGLWLSTPFNRFFVARDETRAHMVGIGLPADRITVSGIPVRADFGEPINRKAVQARYGLAPDLPTLLISAGAAGGAYTKAVVAQTLRIRKPFQAVVVCGRNEELKDELTVLTAPSGDRYRVVGFATDMADLMRVSSLFIGKPGGLSASECMAAGLPMLLVHPIPGQEVRNSDFMLEEGAAVRCNYGTTIGYKIGSLLDEPDRLSQMAANARRLGRADAAPLIVEATLAEQLSPVWISRDARSVIRTAAAGGLAAPDPKADHRIVTLLDDVTDASVGLVTPSDLRPLARLLSVDFSRERELRVTRALVSDLKQKRRARADLVTILGHALDTAAERLLRVETEE